MIQRYGNRSVTCKHLTNYFQKKSNFNIWHKFTFQNVPNIKQKPACIAAKRVSNPKKIHYTVNET